MRFHALALPDVMLDTSSTDGSACYLFFCKLMVFDLLTRYFCSSQQHRCVSVPGFGFNCIKTRKKELSTYIKIH